MEAGLSLPRLVSIPFSEEQLALWGDWAKQSEGRIAAHVRLPFHSPINLLTVLQLAMTYCYERLIDLMKDANLQFENCKALRMADQVVEAALLLCRRVSLFYPIFRVTILNIPL
jgi:hypothetical protein